VHVHVLTLFPEALGSPLAVGPVKRARELGVLALSLHQLRDYATDRHGTVDDVPYGGGQGMVLKLEPLVRAIEHVAAAGPMRRVLLSARGPRLTQPWLTRAAAEAAMLLVCGRYEGIDERVLDWVDEELSVGDYVLSGGETAAAVVIDGLARLLPGAVGNAASTADESFAGGLLEYPQYTRPPEFRGRAVPEVLRSGDHAAIARWRRERALDATAERRPDLLESATLTSEDRAWLARRGRPSGGSRG
jgi:tRNA (guanine37-N1)-methyltransferase